MYYICPKTTLLHIRMHWWSSNFSTSRMFIMCSPELWQLVNNWSQYMHLSLSLSLSLSRIIKGWWAAWCWHSVTHLLMYMKLQEERDNVDKQLWFQCCCSFLEVHFQSGNNWSAEVLQPITQATSQCFSVLVLWLGYDPPSNHLHLK